MKITIAVRTYNRPNLLKLALSSIELQTHSDWEVIVFDDSASDINFDIYRKFRDSNPTKDIFYVSSKKPHHLFKESWKLSALMANGEVVVRLDDDDILAEDALEYIDYVYTTHTDLDFSYGSSIYFEDDILKEIVQTQTPLEAPKTVDIWEGYLHGHPYDNPWRFKHNHYGEPQNYSSIIHCSKANIMCIYHTYVFRKSSFLKVSDKFDVTSNFVDDLEVLGSLDYLGLKHTSIKRIMSYLRIHNQSRVTDNSNFVNGDNLWNNILGIRDKVEYLRTDSFQSNVLEAPIDGNFNEGEITSKHQSYFNTYINNVYKIANKFG